MQKVRRQPCLHPLRDSGIGLRPLVSMWFRVQYLPLLGFFPPFNHPTGSLSVIRQYLALESGLPGFTRSFTSSALLRIPLGRLPLSPTGLSPSLAPLSIGFGWLVGPKCGPTTPPPKGRFGLVRFRSPLLTESRLISFPPGTEMFQFPGFASRPYEFRSG